MHSNLKVNLGEGNDFILVDDQTPEVTIDYKFVSGEGEEDCAAGDILIELGDKETKVNNGVYKEKLKAVPLAGELEK